MRTILISGCDTGIGKTYVTASLARLLGKDGENIQIIKAIETGVPKGTPGDAEEARSASGLPNVSDITLRQYPDSVAPLTAAAHAGDPLNLDDLVSEVSALPKTEWRLVEGAGGIAVPLEQGGKDWCDFARLLRVDFVILVVPDRLGAINLGRLASYYAISRRLPTGLWLNECQPTSDAVRESNESHLSGGVSVIWARQRYGAPLPEDPEGVRNIFAAPR